MAEYCNNEGNYVSMFPWMALMHTVDFEPKCADVQIPQDVSTCYIFFTCEQFHFLLKFSIVKIFTSCYNFHFLL